MLSGLGARELVVVRDGEVAQTLDLSGKTPGEEFVCLEGEPYGNYWFPWSGEDSMEYTVDGRGLWIGGKLRGFNVFDQEPEKVKTPGDIVTVRSTGDRLSGLARFPKLKALSLIPAGEESNISGLKKLTGLRFLDLGEGGIAADGVDVLGSLSELRRLEAEFVILPSRAMGYIGRLKKMKELSLNAIPDEEMLRLRSLKKMERLSRSYIGVDTLWLRLLPSLPALRELSIVQAEVSLDVVKYIARSNRLHTLSLGFAGIDDVHLVHIGRMTSLRELDLTGTRVTDDGLKYLENMKNLRKLWLGSSTVTQPGVERLRARLPGCRVFFGRIYQSR